MDVRTRIGVVAALASIATFAGVAQTPLAPFSSFTPVTDEMLLNPRPDDWINWRRTLDGWGYSPLTQITRSNVNELQLTWSWPMLQGAGQTTPLVHDGVMFLPSPSGVQALDAATGDLIWETLRSGIARRNLAIFGDRLFAGTADAHLVALDARTGRLLWDQTIADSKLGYRYTSGPIVAKGKVVIGMTGCERYKENVHDMCFVSAHDVQTGRQLWRTATVARPGEPGGDTWNGLELTFRAGGDAWIPGSYDPETNLIYYGTSQPKPWASHQRGTGDGAALYTNSTLALDADTGKLTWYYQHLPREEHDLDEAFESVLINDGSRRSLFKMGKVGVLWEIDRKTGRFVRAYDPGYQNVLDVNPTTGAVTYRPGMIPKPGVELEYCPGPGGFRNLYPMAYHPVSRALYIPLKLSCTKAVFPAYERKLGGGAPEGYAADWMRRTSKPHPKDPEHSGDLISIDTRSGAILWHYRTRMPYTTATLTTAGGLVFVGDLDRYVYALDMSTGQALWHTRLASPPDGAPITYAVRGRQYVAIPTSSGQGATWLDLADRAPDFVTRNRSRAANRPEMQVFALPEAKSRTAR